MKKHFIQFIGVLNKSNIFIFFPIAQMAAKYAKIDRVDRLELGFQQVPLVQNFYFHNSIVKHQ